jgi:hypothetical protein
MRTFMKLTHLFLILLAFFLFVTAFLGGVALLLNFYTPPLDYLQGSVFTSFTIPGLALSLLVGGSGLFAAILLLRKSKYSLPFAATAGIIIMFFEFVEVMIIGSPPGPARFMQVFYFGLGTVIEIAVMGTWFLSLYRPSQLHEAGD